MTELYKSNFTMLVNRIDQVLAHLDRLVKANSRLENELKQHEHIKNVSDISGHTQMLESENKKLKKENKLLKEREKLIKNKVERLAVKLEDIDI